MLCCRFEEALQEARQVDKLLSEGPGDDCLEEKFPLLGVPITVKEAFSLYGGFVFVTLQVLMCSPQWWVAVAGLEESSLPFPSLHQALPGLLHLYSFVAHKFCRACGASEEQPSLGTGFPQPRVVSGHWP